MHVIKTGLDYSDLQGHIRSKRKAGLREIIIAMIGALVVAMGIAGSISSGDFDKSWLGLAVFAAAAMIAVLVSYSVRPTVELDSGLAAFAAHNGFSFSPDLADAGPENGTLFSHSYDRKYCNVVAGRFHDLPYRLFEYRYKHDSKYEDKASILEFTLPRKLPNIVIDSLMFSVGGTVLDGADFAASQRRVTLVSTLVCTSPGTMK
ncbi:MAG TPA: hypothetical protein VGO07_07515 [Candidatus Saccharimonadales bacterium]|jgi:hypothetical protein|nr:hypothetical protein [Candidatus Saccharimonadales bacterium]